MLIRRETTGDRDGIDAVHRQAFALQTPGGGEPVEVRLVHALRDDPGWVPALSLVALEGSGQVVGHVVGTVGSVGGRAGIGLGPLGVLPSRQGRRIGEMLLHAVIAAADALEFPVVALLGDPGYYRRFGFAPAAAVGIDAPDPSWGEHFQARRLAAHEAAPTGGFRYAAPFDDL